MAREGAGTPRVLARVKRDATRRHRVLPADPRRLVVVGSALGFGLLVALALRGIGLPLRCGGAVGGGDGAGARRRHHRPAAAPRRPRGAGVLRPRPGHPARAARGRVGRGERRCARRRARRPARRPRAALVGARRARDAGRAPADHRRLGPAQLPAGGAGAAARRARDAAVLRRRPHRPRLAAGVPARRAASCTRHAAGVRDRQPRLGLRARRSWPTTARSSSPSTAGCCAAGATGRWSCASPGCGWPATAIPSAAGARAATSSKARSPPLGGRAEPVRRVAGRAGGQGRRRHGPRARAGREGRSRRCAATRPRTRSCCSSATRTTRTSSSTATSPCSTAGRWERGGTGNLGEGSKIGVARMIYADRRRLRPAGRRPRRDRPGQRIGHGEALPARRAARGRSSQIA